MRQCWPERTARSFAYKSMLDAGVRLALGSDAPVSPLDPWLAIWAAVRRQPHDGPPWYPSQALTRAQALAASTDGRGTVRVGATADLVALDHDPLDEATNLRDMTRCVAATFVDGRPTHFAL
jgi:predicted amidohydrolase YtcJ